jgi:hypothetical protein
MLVPVCEIKLSVREFFKTEGNPFKVYEKI